MKGWTRVSLPPLGGRTRRAEGGLGARHALIFLAVGRLSACALGVQPNAYYGDNWAPPTLSSLSTASELGTEGGGTVTITGSGFGTDPTRLVVEFAEHSATVVSAADTALTVIVPPGPLSGGAVDVDVATPTGFSALTGGYTYDTSGTYDNQSAYVQVNNYWESCLGGLSTRSDDEHGNLGCSTIAYLGYTGTSGTAEGYSFLYPRVHTPTSGFFGASDAGSPDWHVERPGQLSAPFGVDKLHQDVGPVALHNAFWNGGKPYCADLNSTASYRYGGGESGNPDAYVVSVDSIPPGSTADVCPSGQTTYDLSTLNFCTSDDVNGIPTDVYNADWPVADDFFATSKKDDVAHLAPVDITLDAPTAGLAAVPLTLPEPIVVYTTQGITPPKDATDTQTDLWSIGSLDSCFADTAGNPEQLDDTAVQFAWTPSAAVASSAGAILDARTYVRVTITELGLNWFGATNYPVRAVIEVPDDNEYDRTSKQSHLEVPASVMYQFPTVLVPQAPKVGDGYLDATIGNWGYVVVEFQRVTDYTMASNLKGDVVFSYTTGDFGFYGWTNPTESDGCHNCLDDDNDGWTDAEDPDCASGTEETGLGTTQCNDGIDNDGDGKKDSKDSLCDSATDDDESNCSDGLDNDHDGLTDAADPECVAGGNETASDAPDCADGLDNDGDGWTDAADPDCAAGARELGYGTAGCNDGVDNDADGLVDSIDPDCTLATGVEGSAGDTAGSDTAASDSGTSDSGGTDSGGVDSH